jgi:hypothetical protein
MENHGLKTVDLIKSWFIEFHIFSRNGNHEKLWFTNENHVFSGLS